MTSKRQDLYQLVVEKLKIVAQEKTQRAINPLRATSDFEIGILQSLAASFPDAQVAGCWFHSGNVSNKINYYKFDMRLL